MPAFKGCYHVVMTSLWEYKLPSDIITHPEPTGPFYPRTPVVTQCHPSTSSQNLVIQWSRHRRHDTKGNVTETSPEQPSQNNLNTYTSSPDDTPPDRPSDRTGMSVLLMEGPGMTSTVTTGLYMGAEGR